MNESVDKPVQANAMQYSFVRVIMFGIMYPSENYLIIL